MNVGQKHAEISIAVANALAVFILDTKLHNWLRANDPKALEQAIKALDEYGYEKHRKIEHTDPAWVDITGTDRDPWVDTPAWVDTPEYIDVTPASLKTPEGVKRVRDAQNAWDLATHDLTNTLARIIDKVFDKHTDKVTRAEHYSELQTLIGICQSKQDAFFRTIAGR
jgi:hypothetical protein